MLNKFYAVTMTAIYHVQARADGGDPLVVKIALRGESKVEVGGRLRNGSMLAICRQLQMYMPERYGAMHPLTAFERRIEEVNTQWWGGHSSDIVALFTRKNEAEVCFNSTDLKACDARWIQSTKRVLSKIGEDHPQFYISHDPQLGLPL